MSPLSQPGPKNKAVFTGVAGGHRSAESTGTAPRVEPLQLRSAAGGRYTNCHRFSRVMHVGKGSNHCNNESLRSSASVRHLASDIKVVAQKHLRRESSSGERSGLSGCRRPRPRCSQASLGREFRRHMLWPKSAGNRWCIPTCGGRSIG